MRQSQKRSGKQTASKHWEEYWKQILGAPRMSELRGKLIQLGAVFTAPAARRVDELDAEIKKLRARVAELEAGITKGTAEDAVNLVKNLTQPE